MNELDNFENQWKQARQKPVAKLMDSRQIMESANQKKAQTKRGHTITIAVLSVTLTVLILFFTQVAHFQELLSHVGITLMCGGLLLRIIIEMLSYRKAALMKLEGTAKEASENAQNFYEFRTKVHGTITILIVLSYIVGFYLLTPEFSLYITREWLLIMDIGFVFIALTLFYFLRKTVIAELHILQALVQQKRELEEE